jgi:hypothetical protein
VFVRYLTSIQVISKCFGRWPKLGMMYAQSGSGTPYTGSLSIPGPGTSLLGGRVYGPGPGERASLLGGPYPPGAYGDGDGVFYLDTKMDKYP